MQPYIIATFYQFAAFPDYQKHQKPLLALCQKHGLKGTILIAAEGTNATIAGTREAIDAALGYLRALPPFATLTAREYPGETQPFNRMKVRLKKEIVTLRAQAPIPAPSDHDLLPPQAWETLLDDPETIVLDTRNRYEYKIGTFKNAVNPDVKAFNHLPAWIEENLAAHKNKNIAIFCTGGIRCEKLGPYMKEQGFEKVYQLKHGILKYLQDTQNKRGYWQGDCFVFDDRVAVNEKMESTAILCTTCQQPMKTTGVKYHLCERGNACAF